MKIAPQLIFIMLTGLLLTSCSTENGTTNLPPKYYKYLALGDSYTYRQSVCTTCRYPEQLKDSIKPYLKANDVFSIQLIAQTGWTTTDLKQAIATQNPAHDFDLVTLLIGVNNQFQHRPFSSYEQEFPELVNEAIQFAKGDKSNVIVISIPDYAFTPFGQGDLTISQGVFQYNDFAKNYCLANNITFVNITDITRQGLQEPELVAPDGLHPSTLAYSKFVERILPEAKTKLTD